MSLLGFKRYLSLSVSLFLSLSFNKHHIIAFRLFDLRFSLQYARVRFHVSQPINLDCISLLWTFFALEDGFKQEHVSTKYIERY